MRSTIAVISDFDDTLAPDTKLGKAFEQAVDKSAMRASGLGDALRKKVENAPV